MAITLTVGCRHVPTEDLDQLARDLSRTLNHETDIESALSERAGGIGTKGDPISIGTIVLAFLTSGTAVAMFGVLKSYFERNSSLEMEFQREDGKKLMIRAENVQSDKIDSTIELARKFFGDPV